MFYAHCKYALPLSLLSWLRAATENSFCRFLLRQHRCDAASAGVSEVDLGAARFSLPRADGVRRSHLSLSTGARFVRREGGRGHELGEGILPARSVGWGGKILDLGHLKASSLKWSCTLTPIMYASAVSHLHVES